MDIIRFHKDQENISSVEDWFKFAPPKGKDSHWQDGRSAKELAKAWFPQRGQPQVPSELADLLGGHDLTRNLKIVEGLPERAIALDHFRGETSNADLVLLGQTSHGHVVITIEAKADEPFGSTIAERLEKGRSNPNSNIPRRIELLCGGIFGSSADALHSLGELHYQLLTGVAGALIEAKTKDAAFAVFVVHRFLSSGLPYTTLSKNFNDLSQFVQTLPGCTNVRLEDGKLIGPIHVSGARYVPSHIPLYIAEITRPLAS